MKCTERLQLETAIAVAKSALYEVEQVTQFQEPEDFQSHIEQLKTWHEPVAVYQHELELHTGNCDVCAEEILTS